MKYLLRVIIVLLVAFGIIFGFSYYYREKKNNENIVLTTYKITTTAAGETTENPEKLMFENKDGDFQFYYNEKEETAYMLHNGIKSDLTNSGWVGLFQSGSTFDSYYGDWDDDNEKELLVLYQGYSQSDIEQHFIAEDKGNDYDGKCYRAALFNTKEKDDGTEELNIVYADQNTWRKPFEEAMNSQINQLKSCDKYLQLVMDNSNVEIKYNDKTGISDNNYVFYAAALKNSDGTGYQKFVKWNKGVGNYYIGDDGTLQIDIMILAYYESDVTKAQYVGNIHSGITINSKGNFDLKPNTIEFVPNPKYRISDPRKSSKEKFTYIINNSSDTVTNENDNNIDWLSASFDVNNSYSEQTLSFGEMETQIKCVDKIEFKPKSVTLTAKQGYIFSERAIGDFSVTVNSGTDNEYNIAYKAEISEKDARSVLKITFDKKYSRQELGEVEVKFGS